MALKTVWCESCKKPWRPKSRSEPCPNCQGGTAEEADSDDGESDAPLSNTLVPQCDEGARELVERYGSSSRPIVIESDGEINCPECAEKIKAKAKTCRFCGADVTERGARERRRDRDRGAAPRRARRGGGPNECHCGGYRSEHALVDDPSRRALLPAGAALPAHQGNEVQPLRRLITTVPSHSSAPGRISPRAGERSSFQAAGIRSQSGS